jgi:hypothetical protein
MTARPTAWGLVALLGASVMAGAARADALDPAGARELLKRGSALKQEGRCADAVPIFRESARLDPQAKTWLNLADCEAASGSLVEAERHFVEGRDRAYRDNNAELVTVAEERLAALHGRLARLTITLAAGAPPGARVTRDGVDLGAVALGAPMPIDPGEHEVVVHAEGREARAYRVALREGETGAIEVDAGAIASAPPAVTAVAPAPVESAPAPRARGSSQRTWAYVAGAVGVAGIGAGSYFGLRAIAKNSDSNDGGRCASGCDAEGYDLRSDARRSAAVSTVAFAIGAAALGAGIVLFVTSPSRSGASAVRIVPSIGAGGAAAFASGRF